MLDTKSFESAKKTRQRNRNNAYDPKCPVSIKDRSKK
jgi:hypothetical protein